MVLVLSKNNRKIIKQRIDRILLMKRKQTKVDMEKQQSKT